MTPGTVTPVSVARGGGGRRQLPGGGTGNSGADVLEDDGALKEGGG